jgi:ribosomal protein L7/L12
MFMRIKLALLRLVSAFLEKAFALTTKIPDPPYPYDTRTNTIKLPSEVKQELQTLILEGKRIEAIKQVVHMTGAGLKLSKRYVDKLAK